MISRVAENCFWLHRYVERSENTARLLSVNRAFVLDVDLGAAEQWWPVIVVAGEHHRVKEHLQPAQLNDGDAVQDYLTWGEQNPVSIFNCTRWARENARTIREVISLEMWETVNTFWHWLKGGPGRRQYRDDADAFYRRVKEHAALFQGTCHNTMLHEEPFDFMRLGMLLERAGWTARIVDVKHHMLLGAQSSGVEGPVESAHAMALLRSCSATEPFFKQVREAPTPRRVVAFLLMSREFPRSVLHCLDRAWNFLRRVQPSSGSTGEHSAGLLRALLDDLRRLSPDDILERGLHDELTRIIDTVAEICSAVHSDYFDPDLRAPPTRMSQRQIQ